ncbi:MAG: flagellar biosynthesis protein FlhF [Lachnospiraceae bacterium]|nr:flagellar biosynthesis protein FlhF [Lachnospiraceae bacterium]
MIIKKFQGKTEKEATEAAKKELGDGVVVMNVKEVKRKGLFAFLKAPIVEVTVALEEEPDRALPVRKTAVNPAASSGTGEGTGKFKDVKDHKTEAIEEKLESLQSLIEKQLQISEPEKESEEEKTAGEAEEKPEDSNVRFLKLLYHTMLENEINEKYANQIIDELDSVLKPNMPIDYMLSNVYQKMILKFGQSEGIVAPGKGPKIIFFIGPTGVGKTTTIAKIASRYAVEEKKKIALFTTDTYRIAAAEQLRTYANILEVPFRVIYSVEEMQQGIEEFKGFDYIFMDTAGHSHQNVKQREAMNDFIRAVDEKLEKEVYLVVSATTKYKDLISIADAYCGMTDYKLIFTKLDETTSLGNLLNLKLHTGAPLSYVTCGQNVPDDIEDFNPQKTVKMLLGGNRIS